eukprot:4070907-Amphidinium_carterae.1
MPLLCGWYGGDLYTPIPRSRARFGNVGLSKTCSPTEKMRRTIEPSNCRGCSHRDLVDHLEDSIGD